MIETSCERERMESGRLFFDPTSGCHGGNMLFLGSGDPVFRGNLLTFFSFIALLLLRLIHVTCKISDMSL